MMKKVIGAFARPALRLQNGGGVPGALSLGPFHPDFWRAMSQGVKDTVAPMQQEVQQFNKDYPVVAQGVQLANQPVNTAVGVAGAVGELIDGNYGGAAYEALGAVPVLGKYAQRAFGAGTKHSVGQFQQVRNMGMAPTRDMYGTAVGRMLPDAGAVAQANEFGQSTYGTTKTLRGGAR